MTPRFAAPFLLVALACLCAAAPSFASALDLAPVPVDTGARLARLAEPVQTSPGGGLAESPKQSPGMPSPASAAARSLILPGWGQLATGHKTQAAVFGALEVATWITYATFHTQGSLRRDSYFDTARLFAGIDLGSAPDSYRRLVGQYRSSDVYNQYVVMREAAYFYEDSTQRAQFIASRSIPESNAWSWGENYDEFLRYRAERRSSEQAYKNAQYTLEFAIVNRVVSAIAAARSAAAARAHEASLEGDAQPGHATARIAWQLAPGRGIVPDARVACIVRF